MNTIKTSFEGTAVSAVADDVLTDLVESQHDTMSVSGTVLMHGDFVFDASLDDGIPETTRELCKELVRDFPTTQLFIFSR